MTSFAIRASKGLLRNICSPRIACNKTVKFLNILRSDSQQIHQSDRITIWGQRRYFSESNTTSTHNNEKDLEEKEKTDGVGNNDNVPEEKSNDDKQKIELLENEIKELKDHLLRALAEQENIRRIAKRDVDNARSFAVSSFAKSLLDTSDNLTRAMDAVPEAYRSDKENHPVLATLYEGIQMIDDGLTKSFIKNGLKKYASIGDKFDPNLHEALFEYPDPNMEAGLIGQVMKPGFLLNNRVLRPAEVGVIKK